MSTELSNTALTVAAEAQQQLDLQLDQLARRANEAHVRAGTAAATAVEQALEAGRALLEAKALCKHGTWLAWLKAHFEGTKRTAQNYMRAAKEWRTLTVNAPPGTELPYRQAIKILSNLVTKGAETAPLSLPPPENDGVACDSVSAPHEVAAMSSDDREAAQMMVDLFERLVEILGYIVRRGQGDMTYGTLLLNALERLRPDIDEFEAALGGSSRRR